MSGATAHRLELGYGLVSGGLQLLILAGWISIVVISRRAKARSQLGELEAPGRPTGAELPASGTELTIELSELRGEPPWEAEAKGDDIGGALPLDQNTN